MILGLGWAGKAVPDPDDVDASVAEQGLDLLTTREDSLNVLLAATAEVVDDFADEMTVLRGEVLQLRAALETRAPIEQARGMLMMRYGLSAERALRLLTRWSRTQKVELRMLAIALVALGINDGPWDSHPGKPALPGPGRVIDASIVGSNNTTDA